MPSLDDITEIKAEKILEQAGCVMNEMDLSPIVHILEKKLLEEDYTSLELAAALLRMHMGESSEDIIIDSRAARSLDDLDSWGGKDQRGRRDGRYGRGRDARGQRSGRGGRGRSQDNGMARLFLNVGRDQNIKPGDVLGAIAGESGISGRMIGSIDMYLSLIHI